MQIQIFTSINDSTICTKTCCISN